ncbi:hypothetical protein DFJ74DRAFT_208827 [Hyaloraphidium curvatum]|nr:hypothetical protein DFJ74DRAFT_208827 [Hyaloraphidium curvatum]
MAAVNDVFGGPVKVVYWDFPISRGNNLRLVLADLGVPFEDKIVGTLEEWPANKKSALEAKINLGTVPYLELPDGRIVGEHLAAVRYVARRADKSYYPVEDTEKALLVDEMLDLNQDWRVNRRAPPYEQSRPLILDVIESRYAKNPFHASGPYLLGSQITVADHYTYQTLVEWPPAILPGEETRYPELVKLRDAMKERPGIKALEERQEGRRKLVPEMSDKALPHLGNMYRKALEGKE